MNFPGVITLLVAVALMQPPELASSTAPGPAEPSQRPAGTATIDGILAGQTPDGGPVESSQSLTAPAFVTDPVVAPDGAPRDRDVTYRNRLLNAFQSVQGRQGPLDGRWTVATLTGSELFLLQLADPGAGDGRIEGAWRNPARPGVRGSGFIEGVTRDGDVIVVRFFETDPHQPTEVRLRPGEAGAWIGEASSAAGAVQTIVMRRTAGVETAALAAPRLAPEPRAQPARAKARPAPKRAKASKSRPRAAPKRARAKKK